MNFSLLFSCLNMSHYFIIFSYISLFNVWTCLYKFIFTRLLLKIIFSFISTFLHLNSLRLVNLVFDHFIRTKNVKNLQIYFHYFCIFLKPIQFIFYFLLFIIIAFIIFIALIKNILQFILIINPLFLWAFLAVFLFCKIFFN